MYTLSYSLKLQTKQMKLLQYVMHAQMHSTKRSNKTMAQTLVLGKWLPQQTPDKHISIISLTNTFLINYLQKGKIFFPRLLPLKQESFPAFTFFSQGFSVSTSTPQDKI